jgi:MtN3 and saliva related transmembrane protein
VENLAAIPDWSITAIGLLAGIMTTGAFVPQVIRVWRLKRADEISFTTFFVLSIGSIFWLTYGLFLSSWPIILANGVTFVLVVTILALKLRWDRLPSPSTA